MLYIERPQQAQGGSPQQSNNPSSEYINNLLKKSAGDSTQFTKSSQELESGKYKTLGITELGLKRYWNGVKWGIINPEKKLPLKSSIKPNSARLAALLQSKVDADAFETVVANKRGIIQESMEIGADARTFMDNNAAPSPALTSGKTLGDKVLSDSGKVLARNKGATFDQSPQAPPSDLLMKQFSRKTEVGCKRLYGFYPSSLVYSWNIENPLNRKGMFQEPINNQDQRTAGNVSTGEAANPNNYLKRFMPSKYANDVHKVVAHAPSANMSNISKAMDKSLRDSENSVASPAGLMKFLNLKIGR